MHWTRHVTKQTPTHDVQRHSSYEIFSYYQSRNARHAAVSSVPYDRHSYVNINISWYVVDVTRARYVSLNLIFSSYRFPFPVVLFNVNCLIR